MIFVTVGSDLPCDRLVMHVDTWAARTSRADIFAQIGSGHYQPKTFPFSRFLDPQGFRDRVASASVIVAHAGMGTILSALHMQKPVIVFPRRTAFREIRNEHQLATARYLAESGRVRVAFDEEQLTQELDKIDGLSPPPAINEFASEPLLNCIATFIAE